MLMLIRCNQVAQIRIRNKEFPLHVIYLALGAEIEISVGYYDSLGNDILLFIADLFWLHVAHI